MSKEILIIESNNANDLELALNEKLLQGWELNGHLIAFPLNFRDNYVHSVKYIQTLVRTIPQKKSSTKQVISKG